MPIHCVNRSWEKVQGHLPYEHEASKSGALVISSASAADIGCYLCILRGVSGSVSSRACLVVRISPQFTALPTDNMIAVTAGDDVVMTCRASGNPVPSYRWEKIGEAMPEGSTQGSIQGDLKLIRVINLDQGVYRCVAENSVDSISQDITLKVIGEKISYIDFLSSGSRLQFFQYTGSKANKQYCMVFDEVPPGIDPESDKINSGEGYDMTIIAASVGVIVVILLFVAIGVKVFLARNNNKKVAYFVICTRFLYHTPLSVLQLLLSGIALHLDS